MSEARRTSIEYVAATGAIARVHLAAPPAGSRLPRGHVLVELHVDDSILAHVWDYRVEGGQLVLSRAAPFRAALR